MRFNLGVIACLCVAVFPAVAHPLYLFGDVGHAPVLVKLERNGNALSGWYIYLRQGKDIHLFGSLGQSGSFSLTETIAETNQKTGQFAGKISGQTWSGTWRKPGGTGALPFVLNENHDTLANLDARVGCETKKVDTQYGYTYTHSIKLNIAHGAVKTFEAYRGEESKQGDEQACSVGLSDLKVDHSDAGILLRGHNPASASGQRCSVRILAWQDFVYVQMGDGDEQDNDCRSDDDDMMYCSPRSFWADMVADRKTGRCRSEE